MSHLVAETVPASLELITEGTATVLAVEIEVEYALSEERMDTLEETRDLSV